MDNNHIINNLITTPEVKVKPTLTVVKFRTPNNREFIRTSPLASEGRELILGFYQERQKPFETYMVNRAIYEEFKDVCFFARPIIAINRQSDVFIWPIKIKKHHLNFASQKHADVAQKRWAARKLDNSKYSIIEPEENLGEADWPDMTIEEMFALARQDYLIADRDHPVIKQVRGIR